MEKIYGLVKCFKAGGSLVVSIPEKIVKEVGIKEGNSFLVLVSNEGVSFTYKKND